MVSDSIKSKPAAAGALLSPIWSAQAEAAAACAKHEADRVARKCQLELLNLAG